MKRTIATLCAATFLFVACNNDKKDEPVKTDKDTTVTTTKTEEPVAPVDSATAMKNWMMFSTPGDQHKMLAKSNGTWNFEMTMYEPGKPPMTSTGTCVNKMSLGDRYQESVTHGNMMGMPFEGHATTGYNNASKMFFSTWIDNMGTGMIMIEGPWDEATKSITLTGKGTDPSTLKPHDYKEIFKIVDDNTQMMEMYSPGPDGKEAKMFEIKYTRKK